MSEQAIRDENRVTAMLFKGSDGGTYNAEGDEVTGRLYVDIPGGSGTVTSVSVVSANGFAGTVATATTTPAITLTTSITGILKGNGTAISAVTIGSGLSFDGTTLSATGGASGITIGTTTITSGTNTRILYNNAGVVGEYTLSGSGTVVAMQTSPSFVTPDINTATADSLQAGTTSSGLLILNNDGVTVASFGVGSAASTNIAFAGSVALGANNLTMTGSLAATGARVTKGWFTDIESTNIPTVGGTAILSSLTAPSFSTSVTAPVVNATTGVQINGAAASNKILKGNGTNFVASTETYAAPGTSGNVMTSDGTNWTSAAPAGGGWTLVPKLTDETISADDTLSDDSTLTFSVAANKTYIIRICVQVQSTAAADFKAKFNGPASPTLFTYQLIKNTDITTDAFGIQFADTSYTAATFTFVETSNFNGTFTFNGVLQNGANAGTFAFQWAQNTSNASNTTVKAGSYIEYKLIN